MAGPEAQASREEAALAEIGRAASWFLRAMEAEGLSEAVRQRVVNRAVLGDPEGLDARRAAAESDPQGPFVSVDVQSGARYVTLQTQAGVTRTVHVAPWCLVDYDKNGCPVGVELIGLRTDTETESLVWRTILMAKGRY